MRETVPRWQKFKFVSMGDVMAKKKAAKKTGWDALTKKYQQTDPDTGAEPLVPKRWLVKHGLWDETVEGLMLSGFDDNTIRECFAEYGCKKAEVDGYFARYEAEYEAEELLSEQQEIEFKLYSLACRLERIKSVRDNLLNGNSGSRYSPHGRVAELSSRTVNARFKRHTPLFSTSLPTLRLCFVI